MSDYIQVLSESVSKALTLTGRDDVTETAKFASYFDKFFDALNVKSLTEGKHKKKTSDCHTLLLRILD